MKISIIIPNYNKNKYIKESLLSCINQTYNNLQIIVVDNESTDNSVEIIKDIQSKNPNKFIFDTAKNIYPRCWDECIEKAFNYLDGDYYTVIGSDDFIDENYVQNAVSFLKTKECDFFQSHLKWVNDNKQEVMYSKHDYSSISDMKKKLLVGCCINSPSVFYKTKTIKDNNFRTNPIKYSGAADYDLYCQIVDKNFYIENANNWLGYYYRINEGQATWEMHKDEIKYDKLIQKKWRDKWMN